MKSELAAEKIAATITDEKTKSLLDVGCGNGEHSVFFESKGFSVSSLDMYNSSYEKVIAEDYLLSDLGKFDVVWCSHVLEHQLDITSFIDKLFGNCKDDGFVAITVPPLKSNIVGGHVSLWNMGLLLYRIIVQGYDCSEAIGKKYGYNISLIIPKKIIRKADMPLLTFSNGDLEKLSKYFPFEISQDFNGDITEINWERTL